MNKIKIVKTNTNHQIQVPIFENWDYSNREDSINEYSKDILKELAGSGIDYEIARFSQKPYMERIILPDRTEIDVPRLGIKHVFNFFNPDTNTWENNYINPNYFSFNDIRNNDKSFKNSFFKLDLYDYMEQSKRKNFLTIILQNNQDTFTYTNNSKDYILKKPSYDLNYNKNSEGFFMYWFKNQDILNLNKLYMTAKFFNSKTGKFVTFLNQPSTISKVNNIRFYYEVGFDFENYLYEYRNPNGVSRYNMQWYEYINPTT